MTQDTSNNSNYSSQALYLRLLGYVMPHWRIFGLSLLATAIVGGSEILFPWLMQVMVDGVFVEKQQPVVLVRWLPALDPDSFIHWLPAIIIGIFLVRGIASFVSGYGITWIAQRLVADLRRAMFSSMLKLPTL